MTNLFEKFVTADAATLHAAFGSKRTGELPTPILDTKAKATASTPPFCVESTRGLKDASSSAIAVHGREQVSSGKMDIGQKKKTLADPRLVKRQTATRRDSLSPPPPPPPPLPRQKSNSPSSSPQPSSPPPQQTTRSKRSMHGFTIPKRTDNKLIREVDLKSREFLNEILPLLKQSYRLPSSVNKVTVTSAWLVRNSNLERKYQLRKQELASEGRAEKELADCYAFLGVKDMEMGKKFCHEGVRVGNLPFTSLGKPKMGVCLQKHADILIPNVNPSTTMIIFKTIKGRVKAVPENSVNLEPTPNHDYHMSKNTTLRTTETDVKRLYSATQLYAYEYGDDGVIQRPRHICPIAIVQYKYGDGTSQRHSSKQSTLSKTTSVRTSATRATQVWTGQLFNDETFVSDVRMISYSILFRPTHIKTTIVTTHTIPMSEFKQRYLFNCAHISKQREMHIGRNFLLYTQLHSSEIHSFDQMMTFLDQNDEAGVCYCGQRVECFLIPHSSKSVEMGFPALVNRKQMCHCLFVSPYSLGSRLAAERGRLAEKAIATVQQMQSAFGGSTQVEAGSTEIQARQNAYYSPHPQGHSPRADFDQPFLTTSPATSLLKAPVVKAAFEQQALGEDSLLLDKAPKHSAPNKSAETSSYFQSTKQYSSYHSFQKEPASHSGHAVSPNILYSPTDTLTTIQIGGDSKSPPFSASKPAVSSASDQYQPSKTGSRHPVLTLDAMVEIQTENSVKRSSPPALPRDSPKQVSAKKGSVPGRTSPHVYSDDSSHSSHFSGRRSASGSSIPYSPTQFSPYEEESTAEDHVSSTDITQLHKFNFLTIPNIEKKSIGMDTSQTKMLADVTQTKTSARTRPAVTKRSRTDAVTLSAEGQQPTRTTSSAQNSSSNVSLISANLDTTSMSQRTDATAVSAVKQQKSVTTSHTVRKDAIVVKRAFPVSPAKAATDVVPKPIPTEPVQNSSQTNLSDPRAMAKKAKSSQRSQVKDMPAVEKSTSLGKRKGDIVVDQPTEISSTEVMEAKRRKQLPHPVKEIPLECSATTVEDPRIQKPALQSQVVSTTDAIPVDSCQVPVAVNRKDGDTSSINLADPSLLKEVLANPTVQEALAKFQEEEVKMFNNCLKLPSDLQNTLWNSSEEQASDKASGISKDAQAAAGAIGPEHAAIDKQVSCTFSSRGHLNKLSSFSTVFQHMQASAATDASTDKLKVEVIKFTEDIMKKINRNASSTLQAAHATGQQKRSRRYRKFSVDDGSRSAMELSEVSTDDMMMTFEEELEMEAAEEMSRRRRSSGQTSSIDEALAEDIDEALALEELEPLSLGMDDMFDMDGGFGDSQLPHHMGRRSWKQDTLSSNDYELDMFSDISLDEQEMIRKSLLGEDLADQEKRTRGQVEKLLYPNLEAACQTDKTLMDVMKQFYSSLCDLLHGGICHEISCYQDQLNVNSIHMALAPILTLTDKLHRRSAADKSVDATVKAEQAKFVDLVEQQFSKPARTALCADVKGLDFFGEAFVEKRNSAFHKAIDNMLERYGFDIDALNAEDTGKPNPKKLNLLSALCKPNPAVDIITTEKRKELSVKLEDLVKKLDQVRTPTPTPDPTTPTPVTTFSDQDEANSSGSGEDALEEILKLQKQGEKTDTSSSRLIQKSKPITFSLKPSSRWSSSKSSAPATGVDLTHIPLPEECPESVSAQEAMDAEPYSPSSDTLNMANFVASQAGKTNSLTESPSEAAKESLMAKRLQRARKLISAYSLTAPKTAPVAPADPVLLQKQKLSRRPRRITTDGPKALKTKKVNAIKRMLRLQRLQQPLKKSLNVHGSETMPLRNIYLELRKRLLKYFQLQQSQKEEQAKKPDGKTQSFVTPGKLRVPVRPILSQVERLVKTLSAADNQQLQSLLVLHGSKLGQLLQQAGRRMQLFAIGKTKLSTKKPKIPKKKKIATAKRTVPLPKLSPIREPVIEESTLEKNVDSNVNPSAGDSLPIPPITPLVPYGRESPDHTQVDAPVAAPLPPSFGTSGQEPYWPEDPTGAEDLLDIPTPAGSSLDFIQRDYIEAPLEDAMAEDRSAVLEEAVRQENISDDFDRNEPTVDMVALEQVETDTSNQQVNCGFFFIFGYHDQSCNEAKAFMESDGHRRFDFNDPISINEVEQGAPLWIFVHASVLPKIYLLPNLVRVKHFPNSHFLMFDIPQQLPERSCSDLMVSGGIIIPDATVLLKSPPGILTHVFDLMRKKCEVEGPWRMLIHDHILLQLEKLRGVQGLQEHNTTIARASATLKILVTQHKEQAAHFMFPHACDIESRTQLMCAKKIQEQHYSTHRHVIIVTDADPERAAEFMENGTTVINMIELINKYLL